MSDSISHKVEQESGSASWFLNKLFSLPSKGGRGVDVGGGWRGREAQHVFEL